MVDIVEVVKQFSTHSWYSRRNATAIKLSSKCLM